MSRQVPCKGVFYKGRRTFSNCILRGADHSARHFVSAHTCWGLEMHTPGYEFVKGDSVIRRVSVGNHVHVVKTQTITWRRQIRILQFITQRCGAHVSSVSKKKVSLELKSSLRFCFWREQLAWMHTQKREAHVALYAALPKNRTNRKKTLLHGEHATFTLIFFDWILGTLDMANYYYFFLSLHRATYKLSLRHLTKARQSSAKLISS